MNGAHLLRVHSIGLVRDAVLAADAIRYSRLW
jgi:dihydropteroate synthase